MLPKDFKILEDELEFIIDLNDNPEKYYPFKPKDLYERISVFMRDLNYSFNTRTIKINEYEYLRNKGFEYRDRKLNIR